MSLPISSTPSPSQLRDIRNGSTVDRLRDRCSYSRDVDTSDLESNLGKLSQGVFLPGSKHEVIGLMVLQCHPHAFNVFWCMAPISLYT